MDDLKVSHVEEDVITWFSNKMIKLYSKKTTIHRGEDTAWASVQIFGTTFGF